MAIPITSTSLAGIYFITDVDACVMSTLAREDGERTGPVPARGGKAPRQNSARLPLILYQYQHGQGDGAAGILHNICDLGAPVTG
jgi:hypothetical protein